MQTLLAYIAGIILHLTANWVYFDLMRSGERGAKRFFAFWLGWPLTFLTKLLVNERPALGMREDDEGLRELVGEIRRDRRVRSAVSEGAQRDGLPDPESPS